MTSLNRAASVGGSGNVSPLVPQSADKSYNKRASAKVENKVDIEPDAYEFVAVEKEPYINLSDLQKKIVYPEIAKRANIEGKVMVRVLVGKVGKPIKTIIEKSDNELLNDAASKAIMGSLFAPAIQNGHPIDCWVSIPIQFKLGNKGTSKNDAFERAPIRFEIQSYKSGNRQTCNNRAESNYSVQRILSRWDQI